MSHRLIVTAGITAAALIALRFTGDYLSDDHIDFAHARLNIESTLAIGNPIPLTLSEPPDLELIPSMGPGTAQKLFLNRHELVARAQALRRPHLALVTIKGIGPTTAEKIAPWIILR